MEGEKGEARKYKRKDMKVGKIRGRVGGRGKGWGRGKITPLCPH